MLKRDPIFWWAGGIFVLSLLLMAVTKNQLWAALMIGSYLLRPTLASLGVGRRRVDERQMSLHYRSGNIAFVVMIIACVIMAVSLAAKEDHSWEVFNVVIILGLAAKALTNVVLTGNYREAGARIIMAVGLLVFLFVALENGFSVGTLMEGAPWLAIVGIGLLARRFPRAIGGALFVIAAVLAVVILSIKGFTIGQISVALLVSLPLVTAGTCLIVGDREQTDNDSETPARETLPRDKE
jgi:hypothetical protein